MNNILCIGEALIDMVCTDVDTPLQEAKHFIKKPGGAPTNVAACVGALGGKVSIACKVGNDSFGTQLYNVLTNFNVDLSLFIKDVDSFTTMAFVSLFSNGERDFVFHRGADGLLSTQDVNIKEVVKHYDILHFGAATAFLGNALQETYNALFNEAIAQKKFISFDPNYRSSLFGSNMQFFRTQCLRYLAQSNFVKLNKEEALLLTNETSLQEACLHLRKKTNAIIAITLGSQGAMLCYDTTMTIVSSIQINAIDSTGAGDAFVGMVLYQLQQMPLRDMLLTEQQWIEIIKKANHVGAKVCEHYGAMEAYYTLNKQ